MKRSFLIGLLVIISQTIVTTVVLIGFFFLYKHLSFSKEIIIVALLYDCIAVLSHMVYRRGEKKLLMSKGIKVFFHNRALLLTHVSTSLLAVVTSFCFLKVTVTLEIFLVAFFLWIISLISGVVIFYKKYSV